MESRELIKRVLDYDAPERIGFNFAAPHPSDFAMTWMDIHPAKTNEDNAYRGWGRHGSLLAKVPGFDGEVSFLGGNIYGRLDGITKGECIKGALQDGYENLDEYIAEYLTACAESAASEKQRIIEWRRNHADKYGVVFIMSLQAVARDARKMENMLADTSLEQKNLRRLVDACANFAVEQIKTLRGCDVDAAHITDDWGLQNTLYISPESWREIWKEPYARVADALHESGMKLLLHSCGCVDGIADDFIGAGIDAFQFDQPMLYDFESLSRRIKGKAALWSPVDIQKVLPTGDKEYIQAEARRMKKAFHQGGGFIAKDYPSLNDIGVKDEWAGWAREIFLGMHNE